MIRSFRNKITHAQKARRGRKKLERRERSPKASVSLAGDVSNGDIGAKRPKHNAIAPLPALRAPNGKCPVRENRAPVRRPRGRLPPCDAPARALFSPRKREAGP